MNQERFMQMRRELFAAYSDEYRAAKTEEVKEYIDRIKQAVKSRGILVDAKFDVSNTPKGPSFIATLSMNPKYKTHGLEASVQTLTNVLAKRGIHTTIDTSDPQSFSYMFGALDDNYLFVRYAREPLPNR